MLRPYQTDLVDRAITALGIHRKALVQLPTGGGKTIIATAVAQEFTGLDARVWFVCHRRELVAQTSRTFARAGIHHSFIAAGRPFDPEARVHICSIDTLKARLSKLEIAPDVIIWDEAHHCAAAGWFAVMQRYAEALHLGLSATPALLDGRGLGEAFIAIEQGPQPAWLIEQGFLSPYIVYAPSLPDLSDVRSLGGDYAAGAAAKAMTPKLTGDAVETWKLRANGKRTVVFACTVAHSKAVAQTFCDAGIPAAHVDGETPEAERAEIIRRFAAGEIKVLTNVSLISEGFDLAAVAGVDVTIDCVVMLRPTQSLALFLQMVGRALRPAPGKVAIIIDHAGNCVRHGLPDDVRSWPLDAEPRKLREADEGFEAPPPPVTCLGCFGQVRRPVPENCPYCGHELQEPAELPRVSKGMLRELKRAELEALKKAREEAKAARKAAKEKEAAEAAWKRQEVANAKRTCKSLADWEAVAKKLGYHRGWAVRRYTGDYSPPAQRP